jgi:hypothetical protein
LQQSIIDFLRGFSNSFFQGLNDELKKREINNSIEENIEKFRKKIFVTGIAISIIATGFFLFMWGVASTIDRYFTMGGIGFVLIGLIGVLTGTLVHKK